MLHRRLHGPRKDRFDGSRLPYASTGTRQRQATAELHGVFSSLWGSVAYSPQRQFRRVPPRDSGEVVKPFMQAVN